MATSTWRGIEIFVEIVVKTGANSFLDIGVGNGKWGFLFREYVDIWGERYLKHEWKAIVDGIEIYSPYIQQHQRSVYNNIYIGDVLKIIDDLGCYDIIMAGDVLEHLHKEDAIILIDKLKERTEKVLIVSIPLGSEWLRGMVRGNKHEAHVSSWSVNELQGLGFDYYRVRMAPDERRKIGSFVHFKDNRLVRMKGLRRLKKWRYFL